MWNLSDESLLAGLGSGDPGAASAFVGRFERRVFGLTRSILRDRGAAEEAAQEAFVRAWKHASAYDPRRGTVAAWLLTIARNVSINMLPTRRFDPVAPEVLLAMEAKQPPDNGDPAQVLDAGPLREGLARLPAEQRRPLVLAASHGLRVARPCQARRAAEASAPAAAHASLAVGNGRGGSGPCGRARRRLGGRGNGRRSSAGGQLPDRAEHRRGIVLLRGSVAGTAGPDRQRVRLPGASVLGDDDAPAFGRSAGPVPGPGRDPGWPIPAPGRSGTERSPAFLGGAAPRRPLGGASGSVRRLGRADGTHRDLRPLQTLELTPDTHLPGHEGRVDAAQDVRRAQYRPPPPPAPPPPWWKNTR